MGILANENAISAGGYQISNSLRFQSASSQYLSRTPASAGNRQTWTWSGWVKRGSPTGQIQAIFGAQNGAQADQLMFDSNDKIAFYSDAWTVGFPRVSSAVYRDYAAWYHIVCVADTTNATAQNRLRIYVNGSEITAWSTNTTITQNAQGFIDNNVQHMFGRNPASAGQWLDGYMAEVNFIDGQALTPSSFGETNTLTGQWVAKKYTGTYGTNGFYLPFSNGTSTTTLGADSSGNGNNWTLTNFTRSAGVSDCWMYDVPSGNGGASGTQPSSNYAVLQAPMGNSAGSTTISNANLKATLGGSGIWRSVAATIAPSSGKWYAEFSQPSGIASMMIGVSTLSANIFNVNAFYGITSDSWSYYLNNGQKYTNNVGSAYGTAGVVGDVIGIAVDLDNGAVYFSKNGTWMNSGDPTSGASKTGAAWSITTGREYYVGVANASAAPNDVNFGQRSFAYTPPSGYKALCTANLPTATIKQGNKYMDATLYTGNGSTQTITNAAGFKPDWFWIKKRNTATSHVLADSVRGNTKYLYSDLTAAEATVTDAITSFNSNGFSLSNNSAVNANADTYVGWQWQAGQGTTSSNTNGSITSTVSVSTTAGFSVVTYTGTGANATVGHGLGVAPKMIICKNRTDVISWIIYHESIGATKYLEFNTSAAVTATPAWNNTAPTSSVFTVGTYTNNNGSGKNQVAYCFAEIAGFSKFGSYTGNGSADGPFVYCGFRPKFVMIKRSSNVADWFIYDSVRNTYNVCNLYLEPNASAAEGTATSFDLVSNGFKLRDSLASFNSNGDTFIFAAFAESPFANSNSR